MSASCSRLWRDDRNGDRIATDTRRRAVPRTRRVDGQAGSFVRPRLPFENNFAERQIRPAVVLRKNSQSNRSDRGAATQAVLMRIYRTLLLRGLNPTDTDTQALRTYVATRQLEPLAKSITADG